MVIWKDKLRAAGIHLLVSLLVAALAAALVFGVWFPYPYRRLSGGTELFFLVTGVDVVLGPLMTLVVFNRAKRRREKVLDFTVIGALQLAALCYGLWTVAQARPVHLVFATSRFEIAHAVDVDPAALARAPEGLRTLPLTGPTTVALRPLRGAETLDYTMAEMGGLPMAARPELWRPYAEARASVLAAARPAAELLQRFAAQQAEISRVVAATGRPIEALGYVPLKARKEQFWTVIVDRQSAQVLGFLPLDSF